MIELILFNIKMLTAVIISFLMNSSSGWFFCIVSQLWISLGKIEIARQTRGEKNQMSCYGTVWMSEGDVNPSLVLAAGGICDDVLAVAKLFEFPAFPLYNIPNKPKSLSCSHT